MIFGIFGVILICSFLIMSETEPFFNVFKKQFCFLFYEPSIHNLRSFCIGCCSPFFIGLEELFLC